MNEVILIAEDDHTFRTIVGSVLRKAGFEILLTSNGREALSSLESAQVRLVLTDICMPEMEGTELLYAMRADSRWSTIPVIAMTSQIKLLCDKEHPFHKIYRKPFSWEDLIETINEALSSEVPQHISKPDNPSCYTKHSKVS
jgi:CheY-like chemotaxis protein